ncbi:MAG: TerD family protein, partial [Thermoguttaceae bacterium]|nr:TerD family protein [Thermoguttaceae bacterium]
MTSQSFTISLLWLPRSEKGVAFDLDLSAFLLNKKDKVTNPGDFVFYNNPRSSCGSVESSGDNRVGKKDGSAETISIDINAIPSNVQRIVFIASIFEGVENRLNFGMIDDAKVVFCNPGGKALFTYNLEEDACVDPTAIVCELFRADNSWTFRAIRCLPRMIPMRP